MQEEKGNVRVSEGHLREHREAACVSLVFACHSPPAVLKYPSGHPASSGQKTFTHYAQEIAWETEAWIADTPSHMIHFNGDKFLGPHTKNC